MGRRNEKRFATQAVVLWLECLTPNVLIWARDWLAPVTPAIASFGLVRLVRDAFSIPGCLLVNANEGIQEFILRRAYPSAAKLLLALQQLLSRKRFWSVGAKSR